MSFRKYGGTQFSSSHNIVKSNVNTTSSLYVTKNVGQPNTYINFESDISGNVNIYGDLDVSGNLIVSGDIDCSGNVNIDGDVDINGNLHVQENIDCSGNIDVSGNVTAEYMFLSSGTNYTTAANGVVPKSYVDSVANGLSPLASCDLCSNVGVITLSGTQTIDSFVATVGMRVLVNAQGGYNVANSNNGIYIVSSGSWTRATDLTSGDVATGTATLILQGTTYSNYSFVCTTGTNTSPVYIGSPVLWSPFEIPFSLGQGLSKYNNGGNTVIQVDSSLNFIQYLDNTAGPTPNTMYIGTNTPTVNIGSTASSTLDLGSNITAGIITIGNNSSTTSTTVTNIANGSGQQGAINIGYQSINGRLINIGGTATGSTTTIQGSNLTLNPQINGAFNLGASMTAGSIQIGGTVGGTTTLAIGNGTSQTGAINMGTGASAKTITIGSAASTVAVNGTTTILGATNINNTGTSSTNIGNVTGTTTITGTTVAVNGTTTITGATNINGYVDITSGGLEVSGGLTSNNATTCTGILTANGGITATAGIGTTTLTASGLITANNGMTVNNAQITANGGITSNNGLTVNNAQITANGGITSNNGMTVNNAQITANAGITTNTLSVSGNPGYLLTLQNNAAIYSGGTSNILFDGGYELGSITTQDIAVAFGAYQSQMVFNVNWNTILTSGMSITAYNNNSCVGINNPTFNGSYALNVNGTGNFSGMITAQTAPNPGDNSSNVPTTSWVNTAIGIGATQWTTSGSNIYYNSGTVGIATTSPNTSYNLDVTNGSIGANTVTSVSYDATSDYRIKKDVVTLDETFTVDKLRPVTYNNTKLEKQDIGLIAHELQEVYPFLVTGDKDGENFQTVNYTGLIGILIKEIQDLKKRVKELEEK